MPLIVQTMISQLLAFSLHLCLIVAIVQWVKRRRRRTSHASRMHYVPKSYTHHELATEKFHAKLAMLDATWVMSILIAIMVSGHLLGVIHPQPTAGLLVLILSFLMMAFFAHRQLLYKKWIQEIKWDC